MMITWHWRKFSELKNEELYDLLALRQEVFVLEQKCLYADLDFKDQVGMHILGKENQQVVCYARLFLTGLCHKNAINFGRVVTSPTARKKGYATECINQILS